MRVPWNPTSARRIRGRAFRPTSERVSRLDRACPRRPGLADAPLLLLSESSLFLTGLRSQPRRRISWRCPPGRTAASSALNPPPTPPQFERIAGGTTDGRVQTVAFVSRRSPARQSCRMLSQTHLAPRVATPPPVCLQFYNPPPSTFCSFCSSLLMFRCFLW